MSDGRILVAGIGSMLGDDHAGWVVAGQLAEEISDTEPVDVRLATVPLDLLDWLDGVQRLHVVDACRSGSPAGTIHRFDWLALDRDGMVDLQFGGHSTHDYGIIDVLTLADQAGRLPDDVVIWAIDGGAFDLKSTMSAEVEDAVPDVVARIRIELGLNVSEYHR